MMTITSKIEAFEKALLEPTTSNLITAIKRSSKQDVSNLLIRSLNDCPINYKDFPTLLEVHNNGEPDELIKQLHAEGLIDLANNLSLDLVSINNVVHVNVLIDTIIKIRKGIYLSEQDDIVDDGNRSVHFSLLCLGGQSNMAELLIDQYQDHALTSASKINVSSHYKPEVRALISEFLLKNSVSQHHDTDESVLTIGAKRTRI